MSSWKGCAPVGKDTLRHGATATGLRAGDVADYLAFHGRAMSKRHGVLGCFDAFAEAGWTGAGIVPCVPDVALRMLETADTLEYCAFSDPDPRNIRSLSEAVEALRAARLGQNLSTPTTGIATQDGNAAIDHACAWVHRLRIRRAVVFLDPVGMEVEWRSLEAIARAGRVDVWMLIPIGPAIRLGPGGDGSFSDQCRARLDRFLGDPGWSERLHGRLRAHPDRPLSEHCAIDLIEQSVIDRLRSVFPPPAVRPAGLRLVRPGHSAFLLVFASADRNVRAHTLALKAADYLVGRSLRG